MFVQVERFPCAGTTGTAPVWATGWGAGHGPTRFPGSLSIREPEMGTGPKTALSGGNEHYSTCVGSRGREPTRTGMPANVESLPNGAP